MSPKVSVIMGIYNCATTLPEAIDSILNQTYTNWELIMCDDGSANETYEVAEEYAKKYPDKVVLLKNEQNMGLNKTLNRCLAVATGTYIARMDGDDLCSSNRLALEVNILDNNSQYAIVSTDMELFDQDGAWGRTHVLREPKSEDFIKSTQFCHAPCLVRKEAYDAVGGYSVDDMLLRVEDYHLWIKMYAAGFRGINIQEPLYQMRDDRNAIARRKFKYRINEAYVKWLAIKLLNLSYINIIFIFKPIIVGLIPGAMYKYIHKLLRRK